MSTATVTPALVRPSFSFRPTGLSTILIAFGVAYLTFAAGWRQGALFLVGVAAGVILYHAAFGFTSSWRNLIAHRRGDGLRAHMLMLALTCAVFLPVLARGHVFGMEVHGAVAPAGISVIVGAFLFGVGMQLGGGCASGTLYTVGGGSVRMLATLAAFIVGSVIGALHMPFWQTTPSLGPISLLAKFGLPASLGLSLFLFGAVAVGSLAIERSLARSAEPPLAPEAPRRWLRGPWPLPAGAFGLAAVNIATLLLSGRPWGVTFAFALWGSKAMALTGANVSTWPYWQSASNAASLRGSVLADVTSIMDFGILLGALTAAGLAGRFAPNWRVAPRSLMAAILGGLFLGYGARIAYGCNIGAFFGGIASSSLHGWLWFAAALVGNGAGARLRPLFGLKV